ncbi:MAG: hypothetical protein KDA76_19825, partial [Planctomycetaceae bacterium]|nr:hypothetical protein [Planctomycetaceae bacterium]
DIKAKSIHTVVTKPVRRSEIVVGRMLGYTTVVSLVLLVTAALGYFWIQRQVPDQAKDQLIARVPVFGKMSFLDRNGLKAERGINVGDIWEYRSYIEGLTKARAIWTFSNLDVAGLKRQGKVRLEQSFEAFRTYKGDVREQVRYSMTLVNPTTGFRAKLKEAFEVHEHAADVNLGVIELEPEIVYN